MIDVESDGIRGTRAGLWGNELERKTYNFLENSI